MQSACLLLGAAAAASADGSGGPTAGGLFIPYRRPGALAGLSGLGWCRRPCDKAPGPVPAAAAAAGAGSANSGEQDHYAVLGLHRTASAADVKRAYRLLARKYHPDVSRDLQAGELFKSIRFAYEVLSDEVTRAQYDMTLKFPRTTKRMKGKWIRNYDSDEWRRVRRWAELRQRMQYGRQKNEHYWYHQKHQYQESSSYERSPFTEVLRFAFFTLFLLQTIGYRATLTICGITALLDNQLDAGYKMGYLMAWLFGGQGGILLTLCIYFTSWLCGKNSSGLVVLVVAAMWVGANLARLAPLPQGAVLALLYMSIKLQADVR